MNLVNQLFDQEPHTWGLRGDPYMWKELKQSFIGLKKNLSQEEFEAAVEHHFNEIIENRGKKTSAEIVWFESFPQGGMSGGSISLTWWRENGLPLIKEKYKGLNTG